MAHFIFSVVVVFLWLVAWGIYLVFGKRVKHPNAKAIGLPDVGGRVWFSLCVPNHRDFTELELQRIPYKSHISYLIKA
ncbi:hypothetical protein MPF91_03630 [Helicobacter pylori]|uniref:hypothetical protein n=1 Tax=Helicobacter pylori TaxID=210 RepID=UPI001FF56A4C|nr:hypothetical protein [Helicobacter pylori]MCK0503072.1 hypothetical protein [Helicobacter pylori]